MCPSFSSMQSKYRCLPNYGREKLHGDLLEHYRNGRNKDDLEKALQHINTGRFSITHPREPLRHWCTHVRSHFQLHPDSRPSPGRRPFPPASHPSLHLQSHSVRTSLPAYKEDAIFPIFTCFLPLTLISSPGPISLLSLTATPWRELIGLLGSRFSPCPFT